MKTLTRNEAIELYDKLTDLAHGMAAAQGTTPEKCQDSICSRWRKFDGIDEMEEGMLLFITDEESPFLMLDKYHEDNTNMVGGLLSVPADGFKNAYQEGKKLYVEYTDDCWECLHAVENFKDVYYIHSTNRKPIYGIMANKN